MTALPFTLHKERIWAVPILHHTLEIAAHVRITFEKLQPDCVAVELPENMQDEFLHAAARLPDISVVAAASLGKDPLYFLCEPADPLFEGLRLAQERQKDAYCIDLDCADYPELFEPVPDPYAIHRIGLKRYYEIYQKEVLDDQPQITQQDRCREQQMARRLKELSLRYERILFLGGMAHVSRVLELTGRSSFPNQQHVHRTKISLATITERSCRDLLPQTGWVTRHYEEMRENSNFSPPDRQKLLFNLYKHSGEHYRQNTCFAFQSYHLRNLMKFSRNYALVNQQLLPNLFQLLTAAKGCVDHNYAYETWELATEYPYRKNIDHLPELDLSIEDVWKSRKLIQFHLKEKNRKGFDFHRRNKGKASFQLIRKGPFTLCSYPKEDVIVENFGHFLKQKGVQLATEEGARTIPFSTSLEDGLDLRETLRHWSEKKLYVKVKGKPAAPPSSIVIIFDEDNLEEGVKEEKYIWKTTWLGEHTQESDMAFYATPMGQNLIGPGICRCEYGGFMLTSPPRRLFDIWSDPDYAKCRSKAECLLMAAIDYAVLPHIVYVAAKPPSSKMKQFAARFGKKIVYLPIGQLSSTLLQKIRRFHVLDGQDKRAIADEYIL